MIGVDLYPPLADIYQVGGYWLLPCGWHFDRDLHSCSVIPKSAVHNHVARRRKRADGVFHGNWFLKGKQGTSFVKIGDAVSTPHNDKWHRIRLFLCRLQVAQ